MATDLPRPRIGACVEVLPTTTRNRPGEPPEPHDMVGQRGIVIAVDIPVPVFTRDGTQLTGLAEWSTCDLWVAFTSGRTSSLDLDEVEIKFDGCEPPYTRPEGATS